MKTIREVMDSNLDDIFGISVRFCNCMKNANIHTVSEVTKKSEADIRKIRNMGKKTFDVLLANLTEIGLSFSMTDQDWVNWGLTHINWIKTH